MIVDSGKAEVRRNQGRARLSRIRVDSFGCASHWSKEVRAVESEVV
jgi:hypothetical protein